MNSSGPAGLDVAERDGVSDEPLAVPPFAVVSHYVPPSRFGQPRVLYRLLRQIPSDQYGLLSTTRYDREAPRPDQDGPWLDACYIHIDLGFPARLVSYRPGITGFPRRIYTLANLTVALHRRARQIETVVRARDYRAIVACSGDPIDLPASAIAARRLGIPLIAYMFDDYGTQYKILPPYQQFAARYDNPHAGIYGDGNDRPLGTDEVRIVYTGSVYHVHDDAFARLLEVIEDSEQSLVLDLYSSVDTTRYAVFQRSGRVRHHGHLADAEALRVQAEAEILFLPLAFDCPAPDVVRSALPGKFPEYLASGRPILVHAPADSFVAWYCRRHHCAAVVDEPDTRALADTLGRLLSDGKFRRAIVRAALCRARKDFDPAVSGQNLLTVLRSLGG
ncbi:MAG: glycosyltransferase family 4 protein [Alphaproteobacteria bacterium]|nr:MAG: glycosyltransferase family 4 protein [Alphaproteobacteria bacterium]